MLIYIPIAIAIIILIRRRFLDSKEIQARSFDRVYLIISRLLIFLLLAIAIANPYQFTELTEQGDASVTILRDNSTSFSVFDSAEVDKLIEELKKSIPVHEKYIGSGERSAIGDGILMNMQGNDNLLVVTDGNNNYGRSLGDMMIFASLVNTTVNSLKLEPIHDDTAIYIEGPSEAIVETPTAIAVKIRQVGAKKPYDISVIIDGELVIDEQDTTEQTLSFTKTLPEGYHQITATLTIDDYFPQNNVYYKTLKIMPKPNILFVSNKDSPFFNSIANVYNVHLTGDIPEDITSYHTIILDDMPAAKIEERYDTLSNFVSDGNGLIVVGGKSSYDLGGYGGSKIETLLPARVGSGGKGGGGDVSVILVIDKSGSTGVQFGEGSEYRSSDVQKALAIEIMRSLRAEDNLGIIAFDTNSYLVEPISPIHSKDMDIVSNKIKTLKFEGGTYIYAGLRRARDMLGNREGSKNIILISDGDTLFPGNALTATSLASKLGINTYSVGVGQGTIESFMKEVARYGKGSYFLPDETEKLLIAFDQGDEEPVEEAMGVVIVNSDSFITQNLPLSAEVNGYNQVIPKSSARLLLSTEKNNPLLTIWRFGLGRVVALSTDSGGAWASQFVSEENAELLTRIVNWAVGDIGRNDEFSVYVDDAISGKPINIYITSESRPQVEGLNFVPMAKNKYVAQYISNDTGFAKVFDAFIAVNYNDEYKQIGMSKDLLDIVTVTGGEVLDPENPEYIIEKIKKDSVRQKVDYVYYSWIFTLAAIVLFIFELFVRRLRENKNLNKQ